MTTDQLQTDKTQKLLNILKKLFGIWDLAEGIYYLIEKGYIDDKSIDFLINEISQASKSLKSKEDSKQFQKALKKLTSIKEQEKIEEKQTQLEADNLLNNI